MPFEGDIADFVRIAPPVIETPDQRTIRRARELIAAPGTWAKNWRVGEAYCILGALRQAHHGSAWTPGTGGAQNHVMRVLRRYGYTGITTFNDRYATQEQALIVLDAAYEVAGKAPRAKIDIPGVPNKAMADLLRGRPKAGGIDLLTGKPLPPPVRLYEKKPLSDEAWAALFETSEPEAPAPRREPGPLGQKVQKVIVELEVRLIAALSDLAWRMK